MIAEPDRAIRNWARGMATLATWGYGQFEKVASTQRSEPPICPNGCHYATTRCESHLPMRFMVRPEKGPDKDAVAWKFDTICKTLRISRSTFYRYVTLQSGVPDWGDYSGRSALHGTAPVRPA